VLGLSCPRAFAAVMRQTETARMRAGAERRARQLETSARLLIERAAAVLAASTTTTCDDAAEEEDEARGAPTNIFRSDLPVAVFPSSSSAATAAIVTSSGDGSSSSSSSVVPRRFGPAVDTTADMCVLAR
jgi:hypothetical protein